MTTLERSSLDYFQLQSKTTTCDQTRRAIAIFQKQVNFYSRFGHESVLTGGYHAGFRWFMTWHSTGQLGGLLRFRNGLKNAFKASIFVVDKDFGTSRVKAIVDGMPSMDGQSLRLTKKQASGWVKLWNEFEKQNNSPIRYRTSTLSKSNSRGYNRSQSGKTGPRIIIRYRIVVPDLPQFVSMDSGHFHRFDSVGLHHDPDDFLFDRDDDFTFDG